MPQCDMDHFLQNLVKRATLTKYLLPDSLVPTIEAAESNPQVCHEPRLVKGGFTYVKPEVRPDSKLKWVSQAVLADMGWPSELAGHESLANLVSGKTVYSNAETGQYPYAQNYAGHQFGQWAGQLGDGRVITLFDWREESTMKRFELQLKGAGMTPYSRFADGKAVVRSCVREAVISEALSALDVPTSKILSLTELPGTFARRERIEPCAVVARVAPSMVRFGNFELFHRRGDRSGVRLLADYCITELWDNKFNSDAAEKKNRYYWMFREACLQNARTIAQCQALGFTNGVLNTDNMSILGISIDYGPSGFADFYHPFYTPNHDDHESRYGFVNVPTVTWWNCVKLGEALGELIGLASEVDNQEIIKNGVAKMEDRQRISDLAVELIMEVGNEYYQEYNTTYENLIRSRLGLNVAMENDRKALIEPLLSMLSETELEYTLFFRALGKVSFNCTGTTLIDAMKVGLTESSSITSLDEWLLIYWARVAVENLSEPTRVARINSTNPVFVPRNWVLDDVLKAVQRDDWGPFYEVMDMVNRPYDETVVAKYPKYTGPAPDYQANITCSCSS